VRTRFVPRHFHCEVGRKTSTASSVSVRPLFGRTPRAWIVGRMSGSNVPATRSSLPPAYNHPRVAASARRQHEAGHHPPAHRRVGSVLLTGKEDLLLAAARPGPLNPFPAQRRPAFGAHRPQFWAPVRSWVLHHDACTRLVGKEIVAVTAGCPSALRVEEKTGIASPARKEAIVARSVTRASRPIETGALLDDSLPGVAVPAAWIPSRDATSRSAAALGGEKRTRYAISARHLVRVGSELTEPRAREGCLW